MTVLQLSHIKSTQVMSIIIFLVFGFVLISIIYDRQQIREVRLKKLDEKSLILKIKYVEQKTTALKKATQLHPVWDNWKVAQDEADQFNVSLVSLPDHRRKNRNTWIGSMSGEPLLMLATAKHIQEKVASEILTIDYMGSRATIDIAVFGTDSTLFYE